MKPEGSREPITASYSELISPSHRIYDRLQYYPPIYVEVFQMVSFLQVLQPDLYVFMFSPMRVAYPIHIIFLDVIILVIFGDYKLWRSSQCSFLQPHVTKTLKAPLNKS
jgi:hypothetical protein